MNYEQFLSELFDAILLRGLQIIDFHVQFNGYGMTQRDYWSIQLLYVKTGDENMLGKMIYEWHSSLKGLIDQVKAKIDQIEQPKATSNLVIAR